VSNAGPGEPPDAEERPEPGQPVAADATRRTFLATERTFLAWFRTGLATLALAITIGRILPELLEEDTRAFRLVGLGFGLLGVGVLVYGAVRERLVVRALARGGFAPVPTVAVTVLTVSAVLLGAALIALILGR
jgi:putative membrane protein